MTENEQATYEPPEDTLWAHETMEPPEEDALEPEVSRMRPAATPPPPVLAQRPVSMIDFLSNIASPEALEANTKLAAAYDKAVHSLLGPNDVVTVDGREFKKKSAWKKLARFFQVSTQIIERREWYDRDDDARHFNAEIVVRAIAPWGQYAEAVGLCSTREEKYQFSGPMCPVCGGAMYDNRSPRPGEAQWIADKRERGELPAFACRDRKSKCPGVIMAEAVDVTTLGKHPNPTAVAKALHDVTATAQTRASNRAISDLIAAGEVSAEEVEGDRAGGQEQEGAANGPEAAPEARSHPSPTPRPSGAVSLLDAKVGGRGKHAGQTWTEVLREDPHYVRWMLGKEGKEPKLRIRDAKLAAALDAALHADPPLPEWMTDAQRDTIAGLLDTRIHDDAVVEWGSKVLNGEQKLTYDGAATAILRMTNAPEKRIAEALEASPDDDLPF